MGRHGEQVGAGLGIVELQLVAEGFAVGQVHAFGNQRQVFFVVVIPYFVIQPGAQLPQMFAGRPHAQQAAAGREQASGFVPVQRAEDAGQQVAAGIDQRHAGHARHQPFELRCALAGALDRLAGDIQRIAIRPWQRLGELRGVVALAAADIQPASGRAFGGQPCQALGQRRIVAAVEKTPACLDHRLVVPGVAAVLVLYRQQIEVALARAVEAVVGRAGDAIVHRLQRCLAEGAGQHASRLTRVW